jgi:hypothetical protein
MVGPSRVQIASEYASPGAVLAIAGHGIDIAAAEGPAGAPDENVVAAAAAASRSSA